MLAAFSAGLAQIAWDQMSASGAPPDLASAGVAHLLRTVAGNIERAGMPAQALTGPVARGDAGGVRRQERTARALSPEAQDLYRVHVVHNIQLAKGAGRIDDATAARLLTARGHETTKRDSLMARLTVPEIMASKAKHKRLVSLTAYDAPTARLAEQAGVDILLVGDSVGMTVLGMATTLEVTMDEMLHHTRAVVRGANARTSCSTCRS